MTILEHLKKHYKTVLSGAWWYFLAGVVVVVILTSFAATSAYVDFGVALVRYSMVIFTFYLTDKYVLPHVDLIDEIFVQKNLPGSIAVAAYLIGLFLLFKAI